MPRFAALAFALLTLSSATGTAQTAENGIDAAMRQFLTAFNNLDMPAFLDCFAAEATVFHPPSAPPRTFPTRIQGRRRSSGRSRWCSRRSGRRRAGRHHRFRTFSLRTLKYSASTMPQS